VTYFLYAGMYDFAFCVNSYTFSNEEVIACRVEVEVKFPVLPYDTGYTTGFT
jgi:hypothetical protein